MTPPSRLLSSQRFLLSLTVALSGVLFWRPAGDVFGLPHISVLVVGVIVVLTLQIWRMLYERDVQLCTGPPILAAGAFGLACVVATVMSDAPIQSIVGSYGRWGGLVLYGSVIVLFVIVLHLFDEDATSRFLVVIVAAGGIVGSYVLIQRLGLDPFEWGGLITRNPYFGTLGNPNFAAGYLAIVTPLAVWAATSSPHALWIRVGAGIIAGITTAACFVTASMQGPLALLAGLAVLALAHLRARTRWRAVATWGFVSIGLVGTALAAFAVAGTGPLAGPLRDNLELRTGYWQTALNIFTDRPFLGVGLDRYEAYFRSHRPASFIDALSAQTTVDAAHSVPLHLLATGGLLVGLAFAAFIVVIAAVLVTWLRNHPADHEGGTHLAVAWGAAWVAYLVQSAVSIDIPALAVLGWTTAAGIVVASGQLKTSTVNMPWSRQTKRGHGRRLRLTPTGKAVASVTLVVGVLALVFATRPLRADIAYDRGDGAAEGPSQAQTLIPHLQRATELAAWQDNYWVTLGGAYGNLGDVDAAIDALTKGLDADPRNFGLVMTTGRAAAAANRTDLAIQMYDRATALEPMAPEVLVEVARFYADNGLDAEATALLERALTVDPDFAQAEALLSEIQGS